MAYPRGRATALSSLGLRRSAGAVMPFVAILVVVMMGFAAIAADLMRDFTAINQLRFAAEAAALYGMTYSTNSDGSFDYASAQNNITNAIVNTGSNSWNSALWGPDSSRSTWKKPVTFATTDIQFIANPNPADSTNFLVQVRARRDGSNALQQLFMPAAWAGSLLNGAAIPTQAFTFNTDSLIEVIGQPASRIGPGPPLGSASGTRAGDLEGFAALPIAISNQEFLSLAQSTSTTQQITVNVVSSSYTGPTTGQVSACLVNVSANGSNGTYYGSGEGDAAIDQLEALFGYFGCQTSQQAIPPATVEWGSQLSAYDPNDTSFQNRMSEITGILSELPASKYYIVPVLAADPSFASTNQVVGFAYLYLNSAPVIPGNSSNGILATLTFNMGPSVPVRNASSATGASSTNSGQQLPAPVYPFVPLQYDTATNGIAPRPLGVVMAPALSPRPIATH